MNKKLMQKMQKKHVQLLKWFITAGYAENSIHADITERRLPNAVDLKVRNTAHYIEMGPISPADQNGYTVTVVFTIPLVMPASKYTEFIRLIDSIFDKKCHSAISDELYKSFKALLTDCHFDAFYDRYKKVEVDNVWNLCNDGKLIVDPKFAFPIRITYILDKFDVGIKNKTEVVEYRD